jgi:hypothetical protein
MLTLFPPAPRPLGIAAGADGDGGWLEPLTRRLASLPCILSPTATGAAHVGGLIRCFGSAASPSLPTWPDWRSDRQDGLLHTHFSVGDPYWTEIGNLEA